MSLRRPLVVLFAVLVPGVALALPIDLLALPPGWQVDNGDQIRDPQEYDLNMQLNWFSGTCRDWVVNLPSHGTLNHTNVAARWFPLSWESDNTEYAYCRPHGDSSLILTIENQGQNFINTDSHRDALAAAVDAAWPDDPPDTEDLAYLCQATADYNGSPMGGCDTVAWQLPPPDPNAPAPQWNGLAGVTDKPPDPRLPRRIASETWRGEVEVPMAELVVGRHAWPGVDGVAAPSPTVPVAVRFGQPVRYGKSLLPGHGVVYGALGTLGIDDGTVIGDGRLQLGYGAGQRWRGYAALALGGDRLRAADGTGDTRAYFGPILGFRAAFGPLALDAEAGPRIRLGDNGEFAYGARATWGTASFAGIAEVDRLDADQLGGVTTFALGVGHAW